MKNTTFLPRLAGVAAFAALAGLAHASLPISVGNLVVMRFGDGTAALTNASTAAFIEEYTTAGGAPVNVVALPIAAAGLNQPCTVSGSSTSEGFLNITGTGSSSKVVFVGYGAVPGSIGSIVTSASSVVPRVVGTLDLNGNIDTTTALGDAYSGGNIRSATSDNGLQFWTSGTAGTGNGARYATIGALTSVQVNLTLTNVRVIDIVAGNLFCTSASGAFFGVSQIGTGLPTTVGNATTILNGFPTATGPSSYDFWFADAATIYLCDDRVNGSGGIQKWTDVAGTWTLQYTLAVGPTVGCRAVTGTNVGGTITLYATTSPSSANSIVTVTDTGVGSSFTTLATAAVNTKYQGLRLIPGTTSTPTTSFCFGDGTGTACPCGNSGVAPNGCANSTFASGANLAGTGVASVGADTLVLTATNIPGPGLFFQGTGVFGGGLGIPFGDGLFCAGGTIIRMGVVFPVAGAASYPGGLTPNPIHIAGATAGGDLRNYQVWYRDAAVFCSASTFNLTQGLTLTWAP